MVSAAACGDDDASVDANVDAHIDSNVDGDGDPGADARVDSNITLSADAGDVVYALIGEPITLDGSRSTGAARFAWNLGNGEEIAESENPVAEGITYDAEGRYVVVLTVKDAGGARQTDATTVVVTHPLTHTPRQSGTLLVTRIGDAEEIVTIDEDASEVSRLRFDPVRRSLEVVERITVTSPPRSLTKTTTGYAVVCARHVSRFGETLADETVIPLPLGADAYGAVERAGDLFVTMPGRHALAVIEGDAVAGEIPVDDPRAIALAPDARLAVARFRSGDDRAAITFLDPASGERTDLALAFDPQASSDTESGGVPSYLAQLLFSPDGRALAVPSLQANIGEGRFRAGVDLRLDTTLRAVVSFARLDGEQFVEDFPARKQFDDRGFASAAIYSRHGDFLYVAMRGSRAIDRVDTLRGNGSSGSILSAGFAPDGLGLSADDRFLFVRASLSRELRVYDVSSFASLPPLVAMASTVSREPLSETMLRGKQLFNDSLDPRLSRDGYLACAHCHLDGDSDHRVWDFTSRGEGLRRTPSLFGGGDGPLHWTANFDEVQDFENDIRAHGGGLGLMSPEDFRATEETLGETKAGRSPDLDALAQYVESLTALPDNPHAPDDASARGAVVFRDAGCATCHSGPRFTDSGASLYDVGTLSSGSGQRLGETLSGLDTPTLVGLHRASRFFHDGSAASLRDVVDRDTEDRHGATSGLSASERQDLVAYLRTL